MNLQHHWGQYLPESGGWIRLYSLDLDHEMQIVFLPDLDVWKKMIAQEIIRQLDILPYQVTFTSEKYIDVPQDVPTG